MSIYTAYIQIAPNYLLTKFRASIFQKKKFEFGPLKKILSLKINTYKVKNINESNRDRL